MSIPTGAIIIINDRHLDSRHNAASFANVTSSNHDAEEGALIEKAVTSVCPPLGFKETNEHVGSHILFPSYP